MGKTNLTNNSGFTVQLKEGTHVIFDNVQVLKTGMTIPIRADSTATPHEYSLIVLPHNKKLRSLTSIHIHELSAIEIFQDEQTGEFDWRELRTGAEKKSRFGAFLGWFSPKSGLESALPPPLLRSRVHLEGPFMG